VPRPDLSSLNNYVDKLLEMVARGNDPKNAKRKASGCALETMLVLENDAAEFLGKSLRIANRLVKMIEEGYSRAGYHVATLYVVLESPGLVGMGGGVFKPVFEVGLYIDPVLGLPFYPGSTVKGAVRAYVEAVLSAEGVREDVVKSVTEALFGGGAGESGSIGGVVYSDMLPVGCAREPCSVYRGLIVNPHYHRGGEPVGNELEVQPTPVQHVGVSEGLVFGLVVGVRPEETSAIISALRALDGTGKLTSTLSRLAKSPSNVGLAALQAAVLLTVLALNHGIAARSTKGYNVFSLLGEGVELVFRVKGYRTRVRVAESRDRRRGQHTRGGHRVVSHRRPKPHRSRPF